MRELDINEMQTVKGSLFWNKASVWDQISIGTCAFSGMLLGITGALALSVSLGFAPLPEYVLMGAGAHLGAQSGIALWEVNHLNERPGFLVSYLSD